MPGRRRRRPPCGRAARWAHSMGPLRSTSSTCDHESSFILQERLGHPRSGVVDQDVKAAEGVGQLVDHAAGGRQVGEVEPTHFGPAAVRGNLLGGALGSVLVGVPGGADVVAGLGRSLADARVRSGDDGDAGHYVLQRRMAPMPPSRPAPARPPGCRRPCPGRPGRRRRPGGPAPARPRRAPSPRRPWCPAAWAQGRTTPCGSRRGPRGRRAAGRPQPWPAHPAWPVSLRRPGRPGHDPRATSRAGRRRPRSRPVRPPPGLGLEDVLGAVGRAPAADHHQPLGEIGRQRLLEEGDARSSPAATISRASPRRASRATCSAASAALRSQVCSARSWYRRCDHPPALGFRIGKSSPPASRCTSGRSRRWRVRSAPWRSARTVT